MEEIRLIMTEEANRKLMRKGFSIDTTELSRLVDVLKNTEKAMKAALFQGEDALENQRIHCVSVPWTFIIVVKSQAFVQVR